MLLNLQKNTSLYLSLILVFSLSACGTLNKTYYSDDEVNWNERHFPSDENLIHTLFLVGDAGEFDQIEEQKNSVVAAIRQMLNIANDNSSLVLLGDNIYPSGLPNKEAEDRTEAESILNTQLNLAKVFKGQTYVIPGNHDWNQYKKGGLKAIKRQEKYIQNYLKGNKKIKFYPKNGCGDPVIKKIHNDLIFVFVDSQWWLQNWEREEKMNKGCEIKSRLHFLDKMEEIFNEYKNDEVVLFMHHPTKSNGSHGGNFSIIDHVFPLHEKNIWLPLPILGSIYPIFRQTTGSPQDITNLNNKKLVDGITERIHHAKANVIIASGHEHGLQYFEDRTIKQVISGAGSKHTFAKKGDGATYVREAKGFAKILFFKNQEAWLEMYVIDEITNTEHLDYRTQIRAPKIGSKKSKTNFPEINKQDTFVNANGKFIASKFKQFFLGSQYREVWNTKVNAKLIDLKKEGLVPIKKGGGQSSNSLRLEAENGKQYALRSINKNYTNLVPDDFKNLKLLDLLKDQNSANHPYGPMILPALSRGANVYYTTPELVFLKRQNALGNYNPLFSEELYLLEERPNGNWSDASQFGNSKNIIGYIDLLTNLNEKKQHSVDQGWVLKSRLFDLLIHDWDRHDDQWRWASFKENGETIYRPIPRDRDQVFYKFEGVLPSLISAFVMPKFKTMKADIKDVKSLSFNARNFDRYFLNQLDWSQWKKIIQTMQENLSDEVIQKSMFDLPKEVQQAQSQEWTQKLISRRDNLIKIGEKLYSYLSKEVDITGSNNDDYFKIEFHDDKSVKIQRFVQRKTKGKLLKYERTFLPKETKEIRLYGLLGKDKFDFIGTYKSKIRVRIIGGDGNDLLDNQSACKNIIVYDQPQSIKYTGNKIIDKTENKIEVNEYDREGFKYNNGLASFYFGRSVDDGFWFGGGYNLTINDWRKKPYKSKQNISFKIAPGSKDAFEISYSGHFPGLFGKLDFEPEINITHPTYENYFGLGNNSINQLREREYNWVRMQSYSLFPGLKYNLSENNYFRFGPQLESNDIKWTKDRVSSSEDLGFSNKEFERRHYYGGFADLHFGFKDNKIFPTNGIELNASYKYLNEFSKAETISEFNINSTFYLKLLNKPTLVFATALGYTKVKGDLQFYQYSDLGNTTNLRGYRNNRFRGEELFYQNLDLRMHLTKWTNNILPMDIGLIYGFDYGRVWKRNEISNLWHNSHTIGIWFDILGLAIVQPHISFNDEQRMFTLKLGFNF